MLHRRTEQAALAERYALLTFREQEVMSLVGAGLANKQIAVRSESPRLPSRFTEAS
jgi:FixJ family two-component response regulator